MEWERGDTTPGTVMKNLKVGGLPRTAGAVGGRDRILTSVPPSRGGDQVIPRPADTRPGGPAPWAALTAADRLVDLTVLPERLAAMGGLEVIDGPVPVAHPASRPSWLRSTSATGARRSC